MTIPDDVLVGAAAEAAKAANLGHDTSFTQLALAAAASQRDLDRRHQLAREAAARAGQIGEFARNILFGVIFAVL